MPVYTATREVEVTASAHTCFTALTDYDALPRWQSRISECRVLHHDPDGRGAEVEYAIDVTLRVVRYRVHHLYRPDEWIGTEYLGGDFRFFGGEYSFAEHPGGTRVALTLSIDPGLRIPGRLARVLNETVMGRSLEELRTHVNALAAGA